MGRSLGWNDIEETALCKAWVDASEDPVRGNGRKSDLFWTEVNNKFVLFRGEGAYIDRATNALNLRFNAIARDVTKFIVAHKKVLALNKSGSTPADAIREAKVRRLFDDMLNN